MRASWGRVSRLVGSGAVPGRRARHGSPEMDYQMYQACRLIRRPVTRRSSFLMEFTSFLDGRRGSGAVGTREG
ncbi:hypothetical protein GCM10010149_76100 [Nonomuraea roseoviolacea subsp. roseoviolacea]